MKKYINTSNYYLSTTTSKIEENTSTGSFDVADVTVDGVTLPLQGYYWVDVDFGDASKREIFRIVSRTGYNLTYDMRISPNGRHTHQSGASVGLRDFSQLLNSLSTNTDNFGEVEQTGDLTIKVRGGILYNPSNTNAETGKITISDTDFTLPVNATTYIVVEHDEILGYQFATKSSLLLEETGQYPIAKITTGLNMISEDGIIDLRATIIGQGNMRSEVYDPENKQRELYKMDNMEQSEDGQHMFVDQDSITKWNNYETNKQDTLIGSGAGQNIHTINGQNIMGPGNFSLDTILTVGWYNFTTEDGAESFTFEEEYHPLNEGAFIVFTDSGTMMVQGIDYTYNSDTYTITFVEPLASTEHAYVWVMCNTGQGQTEIGSGIITVKAGDITLGNFNVNQPDDSNVDIGNKTITFNQGNSNVGTITTNQQENSTVFLSGNVPVTQQEYDALPESKNTDGNWYLIIS